MNEAILSFQLNQELLAAVRSPKKFVCVEKPSIFTIPSALGLLQVSVEKYTHAIPRGSAASILVLALCGVLRFISSIHFLQALRSWNSLIPLHIA
jgi:hypothetical protein